MRRSEPGASMYAELQRVAGEAGPHTYDRIAAVLLTLCRGRLYRHGDTFRFELRADALDHDQRVAWSVIAALVQPSGRLRSAGPTFCRVTVPGDPVQVRRGEHTYQQPRR